MICGSEMAVDPSRPGIGGDTAVVQAMARHWKGACVPACMRSRGGLSIIAQVERAFSKHATEMAREEKTVERAVVQKAGWAR